MWTWQWVGRHRGKLAVAALVTVVLSAMFGLLSGAVRSGPPPIAVEGDEPLPQLSLQQAGAGSVPAGEPVGDVGRIALPLPPQAAQQISWPSGEAAAWKLSGPAQLPRAAATLAAQLGMSLDGVVDEVEGLGPVSGPVSVADGTMSLQLDQAGRFWFRDPAALPPPDCVAYRAASDAPADRGTGSGAQVPCGALGEDAAVARARQLVATLATPGDAGPAQVEATRLTVTVRFELLVDGRPSSLPVQVTFARNGQLAGASGLIASTERVGMYPVADAAELVARLAAGPADTVAVPETVELVAAELALVPVPRTGATALLVPAVAATDRGGREWRVPAVATEQLDNPELVPVVQFNVVGQPAAAGSGPAAEGTPPPADQVPPAVAAVVAEVVGRSVAGAQRLVDDAGGTLRVVEGDGERRPADGDAQLDRVTVTVVDQVVVDAEVG